jgi:hypothetical protein
VKSRPLTASIPGAETYVELFTTTVAREHLQKIPVHFEKIREIVETEGGTVERFLAIMGPWEYLGIFTYPDLEGGVPPSSISSAAAR